VKALVKTAKGPGFIEIRDLGVPKIPSPDWVLIKVKAAGICGTDLHIWHDQFRYWPPVVLGHEFAGEIVETGSQVRRWKVGDRVVAEPHSLACGECEVCRRGQIQLCSSKRSPGWGIDGAFADYVAMPAFLLGTLLILYFAIDQHWFPVGFNQSQTVGNILSDPRGLVLPEVTLAALTIASFSRYMRSSMMEAMTEDYIRTARAKGAAPRRVLYVHALRNALIPILTLLGLSIPAIVSGALITETVFNYPGMGFLTTEAAFKTDIPVLLGTTLVATIATVAGSLLADVLYAVADPRIRYAR